MPDRESTAGMLERVQRELREEESRATHEFDTPPGREEEDPWPPAPHFRLIAHPEEQPAHDQFIIGGEVEVAEYHHTPPDFATTIAIVKVDTAQAERVRLVSKGYGYAVRVGADFYRDNEGGVIVYAPTGNGWRAARMAAVCALEDLITATIGTWKAKIAQS